MKENQIYSNQIMVESVLPITEILDFEIIHKENTHGYARLSTYIQSDTINNDMTKEISIYQLEENDKKLLFRGTVETIRTSNYGAYTKAEIQAYTKTKELEGELHNRSFQDVESTYSKVVEQVTQNYSGNVLWGIEKEQKIGNPIIQYRENDWQFLQRVASHFHVALYPVLASKCTVCIGFKDGEERQGGTIIEKGISHLFYTMKENSGINEKKKFSYLKMVHREEWFIGDYMVCDHVRYTIYRRIIKYDKGETLFYYELGAEGVIYTKKIYAGKLKGARLNGVIRKVVGETVTLQLDIDSKEENAYAWPWTPEVGNVCYLMPEVLTEAMLYFPTGEEREGLALHQLRKNGDSNKNTEEKELVTAGKKTMKLYPAEISFETSGESIKLMDNAGIEINSGQKLQLTASGSIHIYGKKVTITAPNRIACHTGAANVEICKSFNFYASGGVQKIEMSNDAVSAKNDREREENGGCYQASFAALAAIPVSDCSMDAGELEMGLLSNGSVPKIGNASTAFSMMEIMAGKKKDEVSFPDALGDMDNYTNNGSYALPDDK